MEDHIIKLLDSSQSEAFFNLIDSNRRRLEDFFAGTVKHTKTLEGTFEYCKQIDKSVKEKSYFPYLIVDKASQKTIGLIDVKNIDWNIPKAELGAFIDANFEGQGVITKNISIIIDMIIKEHKFKKLLCRVSSQNTRSINVVLKCGFELEGTIRRDYKTTKGEVVDLNYYGKLF